MKPRNDYGKKNKLKATKTMKNFRLSENTIGKLEQLCRVHGTSQTETVARAIDMLYDAHKKKENQ